MKSIFKLIMLTVGLFCLTNATAQQITVFNQYMYQPELYNPAAIGHEDGASLYLNYRGQFMGISNAKERPVSQFIGFNLTPFKTNKNMALGVQFINEKSAFFFKNMRGYLQYSYHIMKTENHDFSLGLSGGFFSQSANYSEIIKSRPELAKDLSEDLNKIGFDAQFGFNYQYSSEKLNFNLGGGMENLPALMDKTGDDASQSNNYELNRNPHLLASLGVEFFAGEIGIQPLVLFRTAIGADMGGGNLDVGGKVSYKDMVWLGGGFRTNGAGFHMDLGVTPALGEHGSNKINIFGSFENNASLGNSIEVGLGYKIGQKPTLEELEAKRKAKEEADLQKVEEAAEKARIKAAEDKAKSEAAAEKAKRDAEAKRLKAEADAKKAEADKARAIEEAKRKAEADKAKTAADKAKAAEEAKRKAEAAKAKAEADKAKAAEEARRKAEADKAKSAADKAKAEAEAKKKADDAAKKAEAEAKKKADEAAKKAETEAKKKADEAAEAAEEAKAKAEAAEAKAKAEAEADPCKDIASRTADWIRPNKLKEDLNALGLGLDYADAKYTSNATDVDLKYTYSDEEEPYALNQEVGKMLDELTGKVLDAVDPCKQPKLFDNIEKITLSSELLESREDLSFESEVSYTGAPMTVTYYVSGQQVTKAINPGVLSNESLAVLKLVSLRDAVSSKLAKEGMDVAPGKIRIDLIPGKDNNDYLRTTTVSVKLKKEN